MTLLDGCACLPDYVCAKCTNEELPRRAKPESALAKQCYEAWANAPVGSRWEAAADAVLKAAPPQPAASNGVLLMRIADEAGDLRHERDELLRENAQLRRQLERLERQAKKR